MIFKIFLSCLSHFWRDSWGYPSQRWFKFPRFPFCSAITAMWILFVLLYFCFFPVIAFLNYFPIHSVSSHLRAVWIAPAFSICLVWQVPFSGLKVDTTLMYSSKPKYQNLEDPGILWDWCVKVLSFSLCHDLWHCTDDGI